MSSQMNVSSSLFDDGGDSVYDVENETLHELSGFVLDSEF